MGLMLQRENITLEMDWDYHWDEPVHYIQIWIPEVKYLGVKFENVTFYERIQDLDKACNNAICEAYIEKNSLDSYWYFTDDGALDLEQIRDIIIELSSNETFMTALEREVERTVCLQVKGDTGIDMYKAVRESEGFTLFTSPLSTSLKKRGEL